MPSAWSAASPWLTMPIDGAVARRDLRHVVGGGDAAAARHVDDHELRIARNVLAHEAGEQPRILVVVAAGRGADDHADLLALVEIGHRLGERPALDMTGRVSMPASTAAVI